MKRITIWSTILTLAGICGFIIVIIVLSAEDCDECYPPEVMAIKFFVCGLVIIIGSIYFKAKFLKIENVIFDVESQPLLETDEAVEGVPFAGEGIIEPEDGKTINSLYANITCVYFHSIKEKYVRRGKHSKWEIIENIALFAPFYVKDERGKLKVDLGGVDYDFSNYHIPALGPHLANLNNSEIDCEAILKKSAYTETSKNFLFLSGGDKYRISEYVLTPGTKVFVHGTILKEDSELALHEGERAPLIISRKNRDQYVEEFYKGGNLTYLSHFLISIGFTVSLLALNFFLKMESVAVFPILLLGNSLIIGSAIFSLYNRLITLRHRAFNARSNIEIELKRRADLIPNLVAAVKGYSTHEKEIQQIIAESRAEIFFSKETKKEGKPIIPSLVATIENYPELRASDNFQSLMRMLVDTEERIAYSREFYNRSVRKYNTLISQFPFLIVSAPLQTKEMQFISISRGETIALQAPF